jgi:hypothetical protein
MTRGRKCFLEGKGGGEGDLVVLALFYFPLNPVFPIRVAVVLMSFDIYVWVYGCGCLVLALYSSFILSLFFFFFCVYLLHLLFSVLFFSTFFG